MAKSEEDAEIYAGNLLNHLIQHQPNLFHPASATVGGANSLGEAIAALRLKLIEMYKTQP